MQSATSDPFSIRLLLAVFLVLALSSCDDETKKADAGTDTATEVTDTNADTSPDTTVTDTSSDITTDTVADTTVDTAPDQVTDTISTDVELTILFTANEHAATDPLTASGTITGGAANMYGWWVQNEAFVPGRTIVLSGGDALTSTSLATLTQGEAAVAVMNAMSYSATVFGNLDFNYGRTVLEQRISESSFGWVGSNILDGATGQVSSLGKAYEMLEVDGVSVAIVGLAEVASPTTGFGQAMQGLQFAEHVATLQTVVPQARAAGADVVIVVVHGCVGGFVPEMTNVTVPAVDAYFAHRCGALVNPTGSLNGAPLLVAQSNWNDYARLGLRVSLTDGTVSPHDPGLVLVQYPSSGTNPVTPSAAVQAVVDTWNDSIAAIISEVIGYTAIGVTNPSWQLNNFIADSWLASYPDADFALTNTGGIRAGIAPGDITVGEIIDVAPFDNLIFKLSLTGQQLTDTFAAARANCAVGNAYCPAAIAGFTYTPAPVTLFKSDGTAVDPNTSYTVLVNNFMYFGGSGFDFQALDPTPVDTGVFYRQPTIDRLRALATTNLDPLENHLDGNPRNAGP